ncbi:hypothetical protein [Pelagicoccus sp. SDUM812003]|uniref:hypothetical protein n=1 Tax=Pelagicoccus sp. SDUM812003 TaxID=3041267 RepID=UPI00280E48B3|nr:hypothetical protein [Pelagicoccus sp. SDUM812003]MDQ8203629.1 hypothetical protein [Pelagicoccus sp. SDUM812003]
MPNQAVIVPDAIVLKITPSGEKYLRAQLLCPDLGALSAMMRKPGKSTRFSIDLFDQGEAKLDLKPGKQTGFLTDFSHAKKRQGIGRSYSSLEAASQLSNFLLSNPIHDDNALSTFRLAEKAYDALDRNLPGEAILLKTFFVFSRDEGYPLLEEWASQLDAPTRRSVREILNTPLGELSMEKSHQSSALQSLRLYLERQTHVRTG